MSVLASAKMAADMLDLRGWQHQLRQETTDQAEAIYLIEHDRRAALSEAERARAGVPEEVRSSQAQALSAVSYAPKR